MSGVPDQKGIEDTGLASLVLLIRFHGIAVDAEQLRHRLGGAPLDLAEMVRCGRSFGLRTRLLTRDWSRLGTMPLPAIIERKDGSFVVLGKIIEERALIHDPLTE